MDPYYLGLTDLLDQDLTGYEYFQTLSPEIQAKLFERDIASFDEMQAFVRQAEQDGVI